MCERSGGVETPGGNIDVLDCNFGIQSLVGRERFDGGSV